MNRLEPPFGIYINTEIGDKNGHVCTAENIDIANDIVTSLSIVDLIDALRAEEGDSVTILCDNPDAGSANAVECNGYWTNWKDRRFEGKSVLEALSAAYIEYVQYNAALAHGREERARIAFTTDHVRKFFALYTSERLEIAEWLSVERNVAEENDTLYAKRILAVAKDAGKLAELSKKIDAYHAARPR